MRFIREHACEGIGVDDVLAACPRLAERPPAAVPRLLGRTIHEMIAGVRLQRVKQFLVETDLTFGRSPSGPASRTWSISAPRFRKATGLTLPAYRREHARRS